MEQAINSWQEAELRNISNSKFFLKNRIPGGLDMFGSVVVVEGVCELRKGEKKTSYLTFLDVSKAYDSVWREGLWCKMRHCGVEEKFVKVCEWLYGGVEMRVVINRAKSR